MSANFKYDHAYPVSTVDGFTQHGLTKRELFAAMALQGLCASAEYPQVSYEGSARTAVEQADALLAELERTA